MEETTIDEIAKQTSLNASHGFNLLEILLSNLKISYKYSFNFIEKKIVEKGNVNPNFIVAFSKPTNLKPIPEIVVYCNVEISFTEIPKNQKDCILSFKFNFEGQKCFKEIRIFVKREEDEYKIINGNEINHQFMEEWINLIYDQKKVLNSKKGNILKNSFI